MELMKMEIEKQHPESDAVTKPDLSAEPKYPYGLTLHLDNDVLKKIGMSELPEVGSKIMISGVAKVESIHESSTDNGEQKSVGLQIVEFAAKPKEEQEEKRDPSDVLYEG